MILQSVSESELWWNTMPGPSGLVERVAEFPLRMQSVVIRHEGGVPWEEDFRFSVKEVVQQRNPDLQLEGCSALPQEKPGRWLVDRLAGGGGRFFCLPSADPIQTAAAQGLLKGRVLWVSGNGDKKQADAWLDLAARMRQVPKEQQGCLILLLPKTIPINTSLSVLDMSEYLGEYDLHFFSELLAARQRLTRFDKKYLAELAVALAHGDPQRCAEFVDMGQSLVKNPEARAQGMSHIDRHHAIWLAQMRVVFARIEETKFEILQRNQSAVGVLVGDTDEFGNHINEIGDIELRHLIYAAKTKRLYLQEEDFSTVQILHANRNQLAHHHILPYEELQALGNRLC